MKVLINFLFIVLAVSMVACGGVERMKLNSYKSRNMKHILKDQETFDICKNSSDAEYGFTEKKPVLVGGFKSSEGPLNERRFLNALAGPNGEDVFYHREGSFSPFISKHGIDGVGLLDGYLVQYVNQTGDTIRKRIYINMYDTDSLKIPVGFTKKGGI